MSDLSSITDRLNAAKNLPWSYADIESVGGGTVYDREVAIAHVEWDTERVDGHIRRTRTELEADRIGEFLAAAPTDIAYLLGRVKAAEGQKAAALKYHYKPRASDYCSECGRPFPCKTVRALGGETE